MTDTPLACHLCNEPMGEHETADCYVCGELFHLQMLETSQGRDCGDVWIDDEVLALQFACNRCIKQHAGERPQSPEAKAIQALEQQLAANLQEPPATPAPPPTRGPIRRASAGQSARDIARRRR